VIAYHITGIVSSIIFLLTIAGLWSQLRFIYLRKRSPALGDGLRAPTAVLSLNQFVSSFLAFFSFFVYGACLARFNHYLVWTRLAASLLTLLVLLEIMLDRKSAGSVASFAACFLLLLMVPALLAWNPRLAASGRTASQGLIVLVTIVLAQGYLHQVLLMRQTGRTGAVSLRMHQCFLLKDVATVAFAMTMGLAAGWPLLLLSTVSGITKAITLWHFRWVRISPVARERRERSGENVTRDLLAVA